MNDQEIKELLTRLGAEMLEVFLGVHESPAIAANLDIERRGGRVTRSYLIALRCGDGLPPWVEQMAEQLRAGVEEYQSHKSFEASFEEDDDDSFE